MHGVGARAGVDPRRRAQVEPVSVGAIDSQMQPLASQRMISWTPRGMPAGVTVKMISPSFAAMIGVRPGR